MINKTVGHIILKGGTSEELRKELPEFPLNSKEAEEFFCNLGYKASTAKRYLRRLRKNDEQKNSATNKDQEVPKSEIPKPVETLGKEFIKSGDVDCKNLLVDTCALGNEKTIQLIKLADHVTFIYSIIEEMDKISFKKKSNKLLRSNIGKYCSKILEEPEKYRLSTFSGLNDEKYPDNVLLQYLLIIPRQIRPTLLTADKKLAVKAVAWNLPCILFDVCKAKTVTSSVNGVKLAFGLYKVEEDGNTYIENRGTYKFEIIHTEGNCTSYKKVSGKKVQIDPTTEKSICVYKKCKSNGYRRVKIK